MGFMEAMELQDMELMGTMEPLDFRRHMESWGPWSRYAVPRRQSPRAVYCLFVYRIEEPTVKPGIHPKYHEVEVRCACGNVFKTRSTKPDLHLEICNACHPFFTGRQKLIDTEGRVERFTKRFGAQSAAQHKEAAKATRATKVAKSTKSKKTSANA